MFNLTSQRVYESGWTNGRLEWRMQNVAGKSVANGVYLYLVSVQDKDGQLIQSQVKKLVIAR